MPPCKPCYRHSGFCGIEIGMQRDARERLTKLDLSKRQS